MTYICRIPLFGKLRNSTNIILQDLINYQAGWLDKLGLKFTIPISLKSISFHSLHPKGWKEEEIANILTAREYKINNKQTSIKKLEGMQSLLNPQ